MVTALSDSLKPDAYQSVDKERNQLEGEEPMRIPAREALFTRQSGGGVFDCYQEPLPEEMNLLLCLLDGAERRLQLQAKLNAQPPQFEVGNQAFPYGTRRPRQR